MPGRPAPTIIAIGLLLMIGPSGLAVGIQLFLAMWSPSVVSVGARPDPRGVLLSAAIAGYGALATAGGIGVLRRRRWGWRIAVGTLVAGLAILAAVLVAVGPDLVTLSGVLIWGVTLALLVLPATRRTSGG